MHRRTTLALAFAAAMFPALPALAQDAPTILAQVTQRLGQIRTMQADFTQVNADGSRSQGTLSIHRPGRMRMEYQGRTSPLVIVGGDQISIFDGEKDATPEVYPLRRTPLWLVLRPDADLRNGRGVVRAWSEGGRYYVLAHDPNTPEAGQVTFQFGGAPLQLQGWVGHDRNGQRVTVALRNPREGMDFKTSTFSATNEAMRRDPRR